MRQAKLIITILSLCLIACIIIIFVLIGQMEKKTAIPLPLKTKGRIAIVIDDFGYHPNNLELIKQIRYPLTMAVLPGLNYSTEVSLELHNLGFEIILHLPMEPMEKVSLEKDTLLCSMNQQQIDVIIEQALEGVRFCKGVSNHQGSRLTSDPKAMKRVFKKLKEKGLYFLDSFVIAKDVSLTVAKEMRIKAAKRDVFLDNKADFSYIKNQVNQLKKKARLYGKAIGICHDRKVTLEALRSILPQLEKEGYKLVFVSELVE